METAKKFLLFKKSNRTRTSRPLILIALSVIVFLGSCAVGSNASNAHKKPPVISRH